MRKSVGCRVQSRLNVAEPIPCPVRPMGGIGPKRPSHYALRMNNQYVVLHSEFYPNAPVTHSFVNQPSTKSVAYRRLLCSIEVVYRSVDTPPIEMAPHSTALTKNTDIGSVKLARLQIIRDGTLGPTSVTQPTVYIRYLRNVRDSGSTVV